MNELQKRLKKFREIEGVSYKNIAQAIGVSYGAMYNFTSGLRNLKEHQAEKLNEYLTSKGY